MSQVALVVVSAVAATLTARCLRRIVWVTRVTSWSMYPALRPGQRVLTRRIHRTDDLHRGDIVVADSTELDRRIIKRVAGLPGDRVHVDPRGLTVNGIGVDEPNVASPGGPGGSYVVPPRSVLLLGDNRRASSDSRSWTQPYLPLDSIRGRLHMRR